MTTKKKKRRKSRKYRPVFKFEGSDWSELVEHFKIQDPTGLDTTKWSGESWDEYYASKVLDIIDFTCPLTELNKEYRDRTQACKDTIKSCMDFTRACGKLTEDVGLKDHSKLWYALSNMDSDHTFLLYFKVLFTHMWT
jgi:hypothetical protein